MKLIPPPLFFFCLSGEFGDIFQEKLLVLLRNDDAVFQSRFRRPDVWSVVDFMLVFTSFFAGWPRAGGNLLQLYANVVWFIKIITYICVSRHLYYKSIM